jgi:hypothetical protein
MKYISKFTDHLEFLGYKIENMETKRDHQYDMALATHNQENSIFVMADQQLDFLFLHIRLNFQKKITGIMYEYLDEVNGAMNLSRAYIDEDDSQVILQTHWTGVYEKKLFGEFISLFGRDQHILTSLPDFDKIWL